MLDSAHEIVANDCRQRMDGLGAGLKDLRNYELWWVKSAAVRC